MAPMPWLETLTMLMISPITEAMLTMAAWQVLEAAWREITGPPMDPEDHRWRF